MTDVVQEDGLVRIDLGQPKRLIFLSVTALVLVFGLWAGLTRINGAVIASGSAVPEGRNFPVQTAGGGIVEDVYVKEGDFVRQGDALLKLDPSLLSIQLESARNQLGAVMAKLERLHAERTGADALTFRYPALPVALPAMTEFEAIEQEIFKVRRDIQRGRSAALTETIAQLESQRTGGQGQIAAVTDQIDTLAATIADMQSLVDEQLLRRRELEAEMNRRSDLLGRLAGLRAEQSRLSEAINAARIEASQAERQFQEDAATQSSALNDEAQRLILEIAMREEELSRVEVIAPADGIVQNLSVTVRDAVIAPNQTIMEIIPVTANLEFVARVPPISIDEVSVGQTAEVVVASFDPNATPRLFGTVRQVSATANQDERTGERYYEAVVVLPPDQTALIKDQQIVPGMPVDIFLQTDARSVLSFLVEPIFDPLRRVFRE